jgi:Flp pilus assembly pilin Flp
MGKKANVRQIAKMFAECLRDERGSAMTEYLLITGITLPLAIYLFHPDNGLYKTFRDQYDRTMDLLVFFGP